MPSAKTDEEVKAIIQKKYQTFKRLLVEQKPDSLAIQLYTETASFLRPQKKVSHGKVAIAAAFKEMTDVNIAIECKPVEVEVSGNMAYEIGAASIQKKGVEIATGTYICIWKKENGVWRIHKDVVQD